MSGRLVGALCVSMKIAALSLVLLAVAAPVSTQNIWHLWAQEEGPRAETFRWQVKVAVPSQSACDKLMRDEIGRAKNGFIRAHGAGYTVADIGGSAWTGIHADQTGVHLDLRVWYQCLPAGVDPEQSNQKLGAGRPL